MRTVVNKGGPQEGHDVSAEREQNEAAVEVERRRSAAGKGHACLLFSILKQTEEKESRREDGSKEFTVVGATPRHMAGPFKLPGQPNQTPRLQT